LRPALIFARVSSVTILLALAAEIFARVSGVCGFLLDIFRPFRAKAFACGVRKNYALDDPIKSRGGCRNGARRTIGGIIVYIFPIRSNKAQRRMAAIRTFVGFRRPLGQLVRQAFSLVVFDLQFNDNALHRVQLAHRPHASAFVTTAFISSQYPRGSSQHASHRLPVHSAPQSWQNVGASQSGARRCDFKRQLDPARIFRL
jgi:hypothetical protein